MRRAAAHLIIGMPRSGTTLLERIVATIPWLHRRANSTISQTAAMDRDRQDMPCWTCRACSHRHTGCGAAGQALLEQSQWRAAGRPRYVDKLPPTSCWSASPPGPAAGKDLHMVPNPESVRLNYRAFFGDSYAYSYDCRRWPTLPPVPPPDGTLACGGAGFVLTCSTKRWYVNRTTARTGWSLRPAFEAACMDTAGNQARWRPRSAQVRTPIHRRALDEWRRHAHALSAESPAGRPGLTRAQAAAFQSLVPKSIRYCTQNARP